MAFIAYNITRDISPLIASLSRVDTDVSIELRPVSEVPFPAIIVDLGNAIDPMGFMRNSKDMVTEEDIPDEGWLGRINAMLKTMLISCLGCSLF